MAVHEGAASYASAACNATGAVDDEATADALYDEAGRQAADDVNNRGLAHQVSYLVAQYGAAEVEHLIREAASTP
ncbi:hypothetical protein [Streptomyces klenkii]|uniref:hypothetical protein n=1 Tax=Streptomyces klenkii TaxID=1420899 RepID=UPI003428FD29